MIALAVDDSVLTILAAAVGLTILLFVAWLAVIFLVLLFEKHRFRPLTAAENESSRNLGPALMEVVGKTPRLPVVPPVPQQ